MKNPITILALPIVILAVLSGTAGADWPAAWQGDWEFSNAKRVCGTGTPFDTSPSSETICPGDAFIPGSDDAEFDLECTGTITDTEIDMECSGIFEAAPGCIADVTYSSTGTRNGDSAQGSQTINVVYRSPCPIDDFCIVTDFTGSRTNPEPNCSATPLEDRTWGLLKSVYR